jgi:hypothetical protein
MFATRVAGKFLCGSIGELKAKLNTKEDAGLTFLMADGRRLTADG